MPARVCVRSSHCFLLTSPTRQGWQPVAGGRFGAAGKRPPDTWARDSCILEGCQNRTFACKTSPCPGKIENRLATALAPFLGAGGFVRVYPVVGPLPPGRPPATGCHPCRMDLKSLMQPCGRASVPASPDSAGFASGLGSRGRSPSLAWVSSAGGSAYGFSRFSRIETFSASRRTRRRLSPATFLISSRV